MRLTGLLRVVYPPSMHDPIAAKYAHLKDPGIRDFMIAGERFYPPDAVNFTLAEQRQFYDRYCAHFRKLRPQAVTVSDFRVGEVDCRLYKTNGTAVPPVLLYLHGGGFVLGGLDSHDDVCAEITDGADIAVVAVHYRLSPEHVFPAAFEDCRAVLKHIAEDGEKLGVCASKIIVGGDSAGGNLAAALALQARDEGGPALMGQVLIYPGLGGDMSKGSYVSQASAPGLSVADIDYYRKTYCGPSGSPGHASKYAAPLKETDYRRLPPAFLIAAGLDPLHDDCGDYAERLQAAGVQALVRDEPLLVHAFLRARHMSDPARDSFHAIVEACFALAYHGELPEQDRDPR
jgi:acetyl esterase